MKNIYHLEVRSRHDGVLMSIDADQPFGAISKGDAIHVDADTAKPRQVIGVEHTIVDRPRDGVGHKIVVTVSSELTPAQWMAAMSSSSQFSA